MNEIKYQLIAAVMPKPRNVNDIFSGFSENEESGNRNRKFEKISSINKTKEAVA